MGCTGFKCKWGRCDPRKWEVTRISVRLCREVSGVTFGCTYVNILWEGLRVPSWSGG